MWLPLDSKGGTSACNLAGSKTNSSTEINKLVYCSSTCARNYLIKFCIYNWIQFFHRVAFALHNLLSCYKMPFGINKVHYTSLLFRSSIFTVALASNFGSAWFWSPQQSRLSCVVFQIILEQEQLDPSGWNSFCYAVVVTMVWSSGEVEGLLLKNQSINQWLI